MNIRIDPTVVARNFAEFSNNPALQESAGLAARGLPVAEMVQAMAMNRNVLSAFSGFSAIYPAGNLERAILEKVILCVSRLNACQFCVASHQDITRTLGISNSEVGNPGAPELSTRERCALEYAIAVRHDANQVPEDLRQRLRAAFSDVEIVELTFLIGFINMLNWFNNALGARYSGEFDGIKIV